VVNAAAVKFMKSKMCNDCRLAWVSESGCPCLTIPKRKTQSLLARRFKKEDSRLYCSVGRTQSGKCKGEMVVAAAQKGTWCNYSLKFPFTDHPFYLDTYGQCNESHAQGRGGRDNKNGGQSATQRSPVLLSRAADANREGRVALDAVVHHKPSRRRTGEASEAQIVTKALRARALCTRKRNKAESTQRLAEEACFVESSEAEQANHAAPTSAVSNKQKKTAAVTNAVVRSSDETSCSPLNFNTFFILRYACQSCK
jgi:hypothetical protein